MGGLIDKVLIPTIMRDGVVYAVKILLKISSRRFCDYSELVGILLEELSGFRTNPRDPSII